MRIELFNHINLPELDFDLKSVTTDSGRLYEVPSGEKYPSITTVLSSYNKKSLLEWRRKVGEEQANKISRLASSRGTKLHNAIEKYLLNEMSEVKMKTLMPDTKSLFLQVKPTLDCNVNDIYGIEKSLYSNRLKIAGRCDCIANWNGNLSIVDWKTSSKLKEEEYIQNYFMQGSAYAEMFEELTGRPIEQIVIVIVTEDSNQPQIFVRQKHKYIEMLTEQIQRYENENSKTVHY
jgi:hypothetical protein